MISIIVNSWKEPNSIGKVINNIANKEFSGLSQDFELIQVSPDNETLTAGKVAAEKLNLGNRYIQVKDPQKGKPFALKMALKKAKGDILLLTDGEVFFGEMAAKKLLYPLLSNPKIGGATGRPISVSDRNTFMGYISHILTDSAHHRRTHTMNKNGDYYISGKTFFPMSGYMIAMRNVISIPDDVLSDDGYMSYELRNKGYEIAYVPDAYVYVKFPDNLKDYFKQKVRSLGGYIQLHKYNIMKKDKQSRSFPIELGYAWFVLTYPKNFKEFIWSILFFPVRLYTWVLIFYQRVILKKGMPKKGWERIESTKY